MLRFLFLSFLFFPLFSNGQCTYTITVADSATGETLPGAPLHISGDSAFALNVNANAEGKIHATLNAGTYHLSCRLNSYAAYDHMLHVAAGTVPCENILSIRLKSESHITEEVIVSATRTNSRIEDLPTKVEVLGQEEVDEEVSFKPNNVASLLGDMSSVQIQQIDAASGNSEVRIQGLPGRYTQLLRDGLPAFGGFSGGFGILQLPPADLKQIELIKGPASTLFGGGAIAGLINFISRDPVDSGECVLTLNQTTLSESDINVYTSKRGRKAGFTFSVTGILQKPVDVDKDGFSDVPDEHQIVAHPRLFFYPSDSTKIAIGASGAFDERRGGSMNVLRKEATQGPEWSEFNHTDRYFFDLLSEQRTKAGVFLLKASQGSFARLLENSDERFSGQQLVTFSELSWRHSWTKNTLVAGVNVNNDAFRRINNDTTQIPEYTVLTTGFFVQDNAKLGAHWFLEAGFRFDKLSPGESFPLPRLAVLRRFGENWSVRLGGGLGYRRADVFTAETEQLGYGNYRPPLEKLLDEHSAGGSFDVNGKFRLGEKGSMTVSQSFFETQINHLVVPVASGNGFSFANVNQAMFTRGSDTYVNLSFDPIEIYAGYTFTDTKLLYDVAQRPIPLTPKHKMAFTFAYEINDHWRTGIESAWTGRQFRPDYTQTRSYWFMAAMIGYKVGRIQFVLNSENLLDTRQSRWEDVVTGTVAHPVFAPLWAPIDGRVINLSVRVRLR